MKVAIIFSGHTRTFALCYPTFYWHVERHFPNAQVIFSTVDDEDYQNCLKANKFPGGWRIGLEEQPSFTFSKEWVKGQPFTHEPHPISVHPEAVMKQLWQLERAYKLYIANTEEKDFADVFIRTRPDLWWQNFETPPLTERIEMLDVVGQVKSIAYQPYDVRKICYTPWWGRFGGVNDRFAIMGRDAADAYFMTYSRIDKLRAKGCPLHPESLVKASLEDAGITIYDNMEANFASWRSDGTVRLPEMKIEDLAHATLRT